MNKKNIRHAMGAVSLFLAIDLQFLFSFVAKDYWWICLYFYFLAGWGMAR